jgi:hypothetical protein
MAQVCGYCARLVQQELSHWWQPGSTNDLVFLHYPTVSKLLESAGSCSLCRFYVDALGNDGISKALDAERAGLCPVLRVRFSDAQGEGFDLGKSVESATRRVIEIVWQGGSVCSEDLFVCTDKGKLALNYDIPGAIM